MLRQVYDFIIMYIYVEQKLRQFIINAGQKFSQLIQNHKGQNKRHVIPKPPQCKWKRRYEKRIKDQMQENNKCLSEHFEPMKLSASQNKQVQNIQKQIKINCCIEQDNNQFDSIQLATEQQFRQSIELAIKQLCEKFQYCSFIFPSIVKIKNQKYLKSKVFTSIHNIIAKYKAVPLKQNNCTQSISLLNNAVELASNLSWNLNYLSQSEKQFCIKNIEAAIMRAQSQIQQNEANNKKMLQIANKITRLRLAFLQQILHELQIAKIYRYRYSQKIQQLLGRYVTNKNIIQQQFVIQPTPDLSYLVATGLELSDMGLLNRLENIGSQQQKEIYQFWIQKRKSLMLLNSLHQVSYYCDWALKLDDIFNEDTINKLTSAESTDKMVVRHYLSFLDKLQQRLLQQDLQFQDHYRNIHEDSAKTQKQRQDKFSKCSKPIQQMLAIKMPANILQRYYNNNLLRICCKWRKLQTCDGLSAAQMIAKLELKQLTYTQILSQLKQDYIEGVVIPKFLLIKQLLKLKESNLEFIMMMENQLKNQEEQNKKLANKQPQILTPPIRPIARNTVANKDKNRYESQTNFESISISSSQTNSCQEIQTISANINTIDLQIKQSTISEANDQSNESLSELFDSSYSIEQSIESFQQIKDGVDLKQQVLSKPGKKGRARKTN